MSMKYILMVAAILFAGPAFAQVITPVIRQEVVDSLAKSLVKNYIFADTARRMGAFIEGRLKQGAYDKVTNAVEFAQVLTTDLRSVYKDVHLSVVYDLQMQKNLADTSATDAGERHRQNLVEYAQANFGFRKLEILSGNIGYVAFDRFYAMNDPAKEVVNSAFSFLKNVNALIIDLRNNGGGSPEMIRYITGFLVPAGTQLSGFFERRSRRSETTFTDAPSLPVSFVGRPVYILVNRRSLSGAEVFSYDMQQMHRATIIGEVTGGGAHAVGPAPVSNGFIGLIPYARAVNPITQTNFEGVGVQPDIQINADSAVDAAVLKYYDYKLANAKDSVAISRISWPRSMLMAKLHPYIADSAIAKSYAGIYDNRLVSFENGQLFYTGTNGKRSALVALSPGSYKIQDIDYMKIDFIKSGDGKIVGMKFIFEDGFVSSYKKDH
jgi:retinol-binding protein 3